MIPDLFDISLKPSPRTERVMTPPTTRLSSLVDVLHAVHLSSFVQTPIEDRGGLFLVGPPGILKTSLLGIVERRYHDAIALSDMNVQMWVKHLREYFSLGTYRTLVLPEVGKIYERHSAVAANIEGVLRSLVAEGFRYASFEDPNVNRVLCRSTVLGAMTPYLMSTYYNHWATSGFARRFLFANYVLDDPRVMDRALDDNRAVLFPEARYPSEPAGPIPNLTTPDERKKLLLLLKYQPPPHEIQKVLLIRILSVLRWWYRMDHRPPRAAWDTLEDFVQLLGKDGGRLVIDNGGAA